MQLVEVARREGHYLEYGVAVALEVPGRRRAVLAVFHEREAALLGAYRDVAVAVDVRDGGHAAQPGEAADEVFVEAVHPAVELERVFPAFAHQHIDLGLAAVAYELVDGVGPAVYGDALALREVESGPGPEAAWACDATAVALATAVMPAALPFITAAAWTLPAVTVPPGAAPAAMVLPGAGCAALISASGVAALSAGEAPRSLPPSVSMFRPPAWRPMRLSCWNLS